MSWCNFQVLANFGLLLALLCGSVVRQIFFGPLRAPEIEVCITLCRCYTANDVIMFLPATLWSTMVLRNRVLVGLYDFPRWFRYRFRFDVWFSPICQVLPLAGIRSHWMGACSCGASCSSPYIFRRWIKGHIQGLRLCSTSGWMAYSLFFGRPISLCLHLLSRALWLMVSAEWCYLPVR